MGVAFKKIFFKVPDKTEVAAEDIWGQKRIKGFNKSNVSVYFFIEVQTMRTTIENS